MREALGLHPDSACDPAIRINGEVARLRRDRLVLSYIVTGAIGKLSLPPVAAPARTDALWQHTCFEAFVRSAAGPGYYEFNFAPSTQWAAYRFAGYRSGMAVATEIAAPRIAVRSSARRFALEAVVDLGPLLLPYRLGLSAVIEESNGRKSYWALAHPPGKPDFHHADCFTLELP